ncbi:hypothetical protein BDV39DRAFT_176608 [Aspergillus sergii]|uniref:Uncharacterized protein n=1 Tax=Aspergillus sergii TaxID=1034303 RepID=A0A5N6X1R2_9EURO|nr:hypothetical protein BDV39DRAFT_176608 [Aspergillus sergii]
MIMILVGRQHAFCLLDFGLHSCVRPCRVLFSDPMMLCIRCFLGQTFHRLNPIWHNSARPCFPCDIMTHDFHLIDLFL